PTGSSGQGTIGRNHDEFVRVRRSHFVIGELGNLVIFKSLELVLQLQNYPITQLPSQDAYGSICRIQHAN
ncbi:MAG: hypothetical protein LAN63_17805, partial [Acidobacteriia bacterium]|nr:hypothetical protein [Terriglobia bacterium]